MDKYIEMCRRAYDLQREYEPEVGDRVWDLLQHRTKCISNLKEVYDEFGQTLIVVWLPEPTELLESPIADYRIEYHKDTSDFFITSGGGKEYFTVRGDSLHEVALMYYMRVKYNRYWDGDKWIKSPRSR